METMPKLTPYDHHIAQALAWQAIRQYLLFECLCAHSYGALTVDLRLDIIYDLHRMPSFRRYVQPFLHDDPRITAFEDAVAAAIYRLSRTEEVSDVHPI